MIHNEANPNGVTQELSKVVFYCHCFRCQKAVDSDLAGTKNKDNNLKKTNKINTWKKFQENKEPKEKISIARLYPQ